MRSTRIPKEVEREKGARGMFQNLLLKMRKIHKREVEVERDTKVNISLVCPVMNPLKENTNGRGQKQRKREKKEEKIHHPKMRNINEREVEVERNTKERLVVLMKKTVNARDMRRKVRRKRKRKIENTRYLKRKEKVVKNLLQRKKGHTNERKQRTEKKPVSLLQMMKGNTN